MSRAPCNSCGRPSATNAERKLLRSLEAGVDVRLAWAVAKSPNPEELICDRCLPHKVHESANDKAAG
jgi:hypothetical protein